MRQDFFTFLPTFKLLIIGNHKPGLRNVDEAARRRFQPCAVHPQAGRARSPARGKAEGGVAGDSTVDDRRVPRVAAGRPGTARERAGGDGRLFRGPGHPERMASREVHRRTGEREPEGDHGGSLRVVVGLRKGGERAHRPPCGASHKRWRSMGCSRSKVCRRFGGRRVRGFAGITVLHDQQRQAAE